MKKFSLDSKKLVYAALLASVAIVDVQAEDEILFSCLSADSNHTILVTRGDVLINDEPASGKQEKGKVYVGDISKDGDMETEAVNQASDSLINGRERSNTENLKRAFEDSIIRVKVQDQDDLLVDQMDFLTGKIKANEDEFEVKYRNSGLLKSHKMTLKIDNISGEGTFSEVESEFFNKKVDKKYQFTDCNKVF